MSFLLTQCDFSTCLIYSADMLKNIVISSLNYRRRRMRRRKKGKPSPIQIRTPTRSNACYNWTPLLSAVPRVLWAVRKNSPMKRIPVQAVRIHRLAGSIETSATLLHLCLRKIIEHRIPTVTHLLRNGLEQTAANVTKRHTKTRLAFHRVKHNIPTILNIQT